MSHRIVDGPIEILKCITPGCYWVKCAHCTGTHRIPESIVHKPYRGGFFPPSGASVFVHDSDGFFYRGTIRGQRENMDYSVQLWDTFQVVDFKDHQVFPTFGEDQADCSSAHMVSLQDTLPALPPADFGVYREEARGEIVCFEKIVRDWDKLVLSMFPAVPADFLRNGCSTRFKWTSSIKGSTYGRIYYYDNKIKEEVSLSGIITFLKIARRVTHLFEKTVTMLQSYPLHRGFEFMPHVYPYGLDVPIVVKRKIRKPLDMKQLQVHEADKNLYLNLINQGALVMMLTEPPRENDTVIRFVTPDGLIALASVLYAKIHYCHVTTDLTTDQMKAKKKLKQFFDKSEYDPDHNFISHLMTTDINWSDSSVSESDLESEKPNLGILDYGFESAYRSFTEGGGTLNFLPENKIISDFKFGGSLQRMLDDLAVQSLLPWQKVLLPCLTQEKNNVIIGPRGNKKLTTSLICILASILSTTSEEHSTPISISPKLVVFVPDFHRADHAARLCLQLSTSLKVITVTTIGFSSTQHKEAIGCDVMITTLGNWVKLVVDSQTLSFDSSRVAYLIFDCFDKFCTNYTLQLEKTYDNLQKLCINPKLQTVILSNYSCPNLGCYLEKLKTFCICTTDILAAYFTSKHKPTVVLVSNDWVIHLKQILTNESKSKKLLLCLNSSQVVAIKKKTFHLNDMLYVHENLPKEQIMSVIERWRTEERWLLVASDVVFEDTKFTNDANVLISWDLDSREKLIKRFQSISKHYLGEGPPISVYLFCDRNSLCSLSLINEIFLGVPGVNYVNGHLYEIIKAVKENKCTISKCCPDMLTFGTCYRVHCDCKHVIPDFDIVSSGSPCHFVKIKMVKFRSAFHLTARVEEIVSNQITDENPLLSLVSRLAEIKDGLSRAYEAASLSSDLMDHLEIGRVVGVKQVHDGKVDLKRGEIVSSVIEEAFVEVEFLDYDISTRRISVSDIFPIHEDLLMLPRDMVDIHLSDLKPTEPELDWSYEATTVLKLFVKLLKSDLGNSNLTWLVGPVKASVQRQLIVDSFHVRQREYLNFISLKDIILDNGFVNRNTDGSRGISNLSAQHHKPPNGIDRVVLQDCYMPAVVSSIHDPSLFFVKLEEDSDSFKEFTNRLNAFMEETKLNLPVVVLDELCAVKKGDSWNRASIFRNNMVDPETKRCNRVLIRYIDYGDSDDVHVSELFSLPTELAAIPPFAIECKLAGTQSISESWDEKAFQAFNSRVWTDENEMKLLTVKFCDLDDKTGAPNLVILKDPSVPDEPSLNCWLVAEEGIAQWDDSTVHHLLPPQQKTD